jgi:hypothetical protein
MNEPSNEKVFYKSGKKDEEYWFEGDRFIQDAFNLRDGTEYYEIYSKYISLVEFVRSENYFRKK